jgi:hypothetical protein
MGKRSRKLHMASVAEMSVVAVPKKQTDLPGQQ